AGRTQTRHPTIHRPQTRVTPGTAGALSQADPRSLPPRRKATPLSSALPRVAAATVSATIAVVAAAGAATADTRTHTSLSIRSVKTAVDAGGHDTVSGVLLAAGHALAGADVALDAKPAGAASF